MEKFGMSFGGGAGRKELLDALEAQKKQLVQYQSRFKDVVQAYKSLLKEKEALEASLKVLMEAQEAQEGDLNATSDLHQDGCSLHSEDSEDTAASGDTPSEGGEEDRAAATLRSDTSAVGAEQQQATPPSAEADRRGAQLKNQLSTLTGALATVTHEKSRMEASFQADKRQLKQEVEALQERLGGARAAQEAELRAAQQQLAEGRARIITQQHEREREQEDHAQQLRELQRLLQQERELRQDRGAESQTHLSQVREERDELKTRLRAAEEDHKRPDPRVDRLQRELTELKGRLQQQTHLESTQACEAEERAGERAQAAEARVSGLEQRLSELSSVLGRCETARQRDQQEAQRLRDRLLQLDADNETPAGRTTSDPAGDEAQLDVGVLKEKLETVKKLLSLAAQRNPLQSIQSSQSIQSIQSNQSSQSSQSIQSIQSSQSTQSIQSSQSIQSIQSPLEAPLSGDDASALYERELQQLKDEFERYKLRAQVALKNKSARDGSAARELEALREQHAALREKYVDLRLQSGEADTRHRLQLEEGRRRAAALQLAHEREAERAAAAHRDELLRLEAELHKQRERTVALLGEKDRELERLRAPRRGHDDGAADGERRSGLETEGDVVSRALRRAAPGEPALLLYAEHLARKEAEAGGLRRHKHRLEEDVHQLQARLVANEERHGEEAARLGGQLDKLIRDQSREGANMEYLKNVTYKFLTLQDASGRQQTLNAILTILQFSPQEKHAVMGLQGATWWPSKR